MTITKAAIIFIKTNSQSKEVMFVRAGNKPYFVLPGGKVEPNEPMDVALQRELQEELGVQAINYKPLGKVTGNTPDGRTIIEHIYVGDFAGNPNPQSEIAEITWFTRDDILQNKDSMTPLTLNKIVPLLDENKLW